MAHIKKLNDAATGVDDVSGAERILAGDAIVLLGSSGIHADSLSPESLERALFAKTDYDAQLSDGGLYGDAIFEPPYDYVPFFEECLRRGVDIHAKTDLRNGWRKLMHAPQPLAYVIDTLPEPQPIFSFIQERGPVDEREMYANFNMGAGFALYVPETDMRKIQEAYDALHPTERPYKMLWAGSVFAAKEKQVVIRPKGITFNADELKVR